MKNSISVGLDVHKATVSVTTAEDGRQRDARASIGRYIGLYNGRRPHSSLDRQTPDQAYFSNVPRPLAA